MALAMPLPRAESFRGPLRPRSSVGRIPQDGPSWWMFSSAKRGKWSILIRQVLSVQLCVTWYLFPLTNDRRIGLDQGHAAVADQSW